MTKAVKQHLYKFSYSQGIQLLSSTKGTRTFVFSFGTEEWFGGSSHTITNPFRQETLAQSKLCSREAGENQSL